MFQFFSGTVNAQSCTPTNINGTSLNFTCLQSCADLNFQIPDIRGTENYVVNAIPYNPLPYVTAAPALTLACASQDDKYFDITNIPFQFCFYGINYSQLSVSTNGAITFDIRNALRGSNYNLNTGVVLPYEGTGSQGSGSCPNPDNNVRLPLAAIFGPFCDIFPQAGDPNYKIEARIEGISPCSRYIISFSRIPMYGCGTLRMTSQIVLYESTGVIDVFIESKPNCTNNTSGLGIVGIQNSLVGTPGELAVTAPGRGANNGPWSATNEGWRFTPSGATSNFVNSELYVLGGTVPISTATTTNTTPGLIDITFSNICFSAATQQYRVRTTYSSCSNPLDFIIIDDTVTVNKLLMPVIIGMGPTSCAGASNGTLHVSPTGIAPYSYSLDGGALVNSPGDYTFMNVSAGWHTIIAYDVNGCATDLTDVEVWNGPPITTTAAKTDVLCNGNANGTITVTQPTIGIAPFEYSLDGTNWQTSNVFNGLVANTYTVFFREGNGCQNSLSITVAEPLVLSASSSFAPVVCNGESNGVITINSAGGVTPYQYSIDGGTTWQASNIFNVQANPYTVTIRDANNCITTQSVTVTEPAALTASSANSPASCDGGDDGIINITAAGGNVGYEYSIDNGTTWQASNIFNTGPGNFTITVRDGKNCTTSFPTTVALANNFTFTPQTDAVICEGASTQLELISNATQYSWSPATGLSDATISNPVANPTITTQYTVTATLGRCSADDIVIVNVNAAPIPDAGTDGYICYGQTYQLQASGGTQYQWTPDTYLNSATIANPVAAATKDITYTLSILSDANGCPSLTTDEVYVDVTPPIKVTTLPYDTIGYSGDQFQLLAVPNDSDVINYLWTPSKGLNDPRIHNPTVTLGANGDVTQYQVITSTIAGCKGEGYITVRVYKGPDIYVPTAFTPNGDGRNDRFLPVPVGIKSLNYFRVFNRWGQLLFQTKTLHDGWDGKFNSTQQASGVYVWMIEAVTNQDKVITKKGTVTIIR